MFFNLRGPHAHFSSYLLWYSWKGKNNLEELNYNHDRTHIRQFFVTNTINDTNLYNRSLYNSASENWKFYLRLSDSNSYIVKLWLNHFTLEITWLLLFWPDGSLNFFICKFEQKIVYSHNIYIKRLFLLIDYNYSGNHFTHGQAMFFRNNV